MGFNVKDYMLPPGTLIRFDGMGGNQSLSYIYHSVGIRAGDIALVLNHKKPMLLDILVGDKIITLDFEHIADIIGWVPEFNPIYCGSGFREYPRWYPKYCYTYDI
jgi:hypothetical protein